MDRQAKLSFIKAFAAGDADVYDLFVGDLWIEIGDRFTGDGYFFTKEQTKKIIEAHRRQGKECVVIKIGESPEIKAWIEGITKPFAG